jgi:hypothetical protein
MVSVCIVVESAAEIEIIVADRIAMGDQPTGSQRMHGAQIVVDYLVRQGVPYAVGIPGHGCWNLTDALLDRSDEIRTLQVMHEPSAVLLADG